MMMDLEHALQLIDNLQIDTFFAFLQDKVQDKVTFNLLRNGFIHKDIGADYYQRLKVFAHRELAQDTSYQPLHYNVPLCPNHFLGRQAELQRVHDFFTNPAQHQRILLLSAIGGMGKTTLMQKYLYEPVCQAYFRRVLYVAVNKNLESAFVFGVADALGIDLKGIPKPEEQLQVVKNALKRLEGNTLIVIDNINEDEKTDLVSMKMHWEETKCKFLITTRTTPDAYAQATIWLEELNETDALLLFEHHYAPNQSPQADIQALLQHINRHTLLTELLAKVGKKRGFSAERLLQSLKAQDAQNPNLAQSTKSSTLQSKVNIGAHAQNTFRLPEATLHAYILSLFEPERLDDTGKEMVRFFSVLPPDDMPIGDLCLLWRVEEKEALAFEDSLDELKQSGWIQGKHTERQDAQEQNLAYKMHPLVQEVVYEKLTPNINNVRPLVITITQMLAQPLNFSHRFQPYAKSVIDKLNLLNSLNSKPQN